MHSLTCTRSWESQAKLAVLRRGLCWQMASLFVPSCATPMVATSDIGRVVAETLQQTWLGKRIIEIEGPRQYSPNDIAAIFESLLGRSVQAIAVPREQWATFFEGQGATPHTTAPRIEMLDGFNSGWIDFEREGMEHVVGRVPMEEVLGTILASSR